MSFLSSVRHPWKGPRIVAKSSSAAREQPVPERCEAGWPKGHSWAWCAHRGSRDCWHWHTGCTRLPAIPAALKTGVPPGWEVGWDPHEQCSSGVKAPLLQGCCEAWVLPRFWDGSKMESWLEEKIWAMCFSSVLQKDSDSRCLTMALSKSCIVGELKCKFRFGSSVACLHLCWPVPLSVASLFPAHNRTFLLF